MMKKFYLMLLMLVMATMSVNAQRTMDKLDRGLVAVKTGSGIFCSWRIMGEEYYDVTYNIYRDGTKLNATPLNTSNYTDASGSTSSKYTVSAVVRGKEQAQCKAVTPWAQSYLEIVPDHSPLTSTFEIVRSPVSRSFVNSAVIGSVVIAPASFVFPVSLNPSASASVIVYSTSVGRPSAVALAPPFSFTSATPPLKVTAP